MSRENGRLVVLVYAIVMTISYYIVFSRELENRRRNSLEPQPLTLTELLAGRAGKNAHVAISNFRLCDQYIHVRFRGGTHTEEERRGIYMIGIRVGPAGGGHAPEPPGVLVHPKTSHFEFTHER